MRRLATDVPPAVDSVQVTFVGLVVIVSPPFGALTVTGGWGRPLSHRSVLPSTWLRIVDGSWPGSIADHSKNIVARRDVEPAHTAVPGTPRTLELSQRKPQLSTPLGSPLVQS